MRVLPVEILEHQLSEIAETERDLEARKEMLQSLIAQAVGNGAAPTPAPTEPGGTLGASTAIRQLLEHKPGLTAPEVTSTLAKVVQTRSKNPKRVLLTTLSNLYRRGEVTRKRKRYYLAA
jgi:hypothetical protein